MKKLLIPLLLLTGCHKGMTKIHYSKNVNKCIENLEHLEDWLQRDYDEGKIPIEIANNFMKKYDKKFLIESVSKAPTEDIWYFINDKLENEWCEYHLKEATLRLLCITCHKKKTYRKRISRDITSLKT